MSWADAAISDLMAGRVVTVRPHGNSMTPRVVSGQLVKIAPLGMKVPSKGDVVLVKVRGHVYLHLVSAVAGDRFQISNNHGHINGWVDRAALYGIAVV